MGARRGPELSQPWGPLQGGSAQNGPVVPSGAVSGAGPGLCGQPCVAVPREGPGTAEGGAAAGGRLSR